MKKILLSVLSLVLVLTLTSCGGSNTGTEAFMDGSEKVLGMKRFILYIAFVMAFSLVTGMIVNLVV